MTPREGKRTSQTCPKAKRGKVIEPGMILATGPRARKSVWGCTRHHTSGGLTRNKLVKSKDGELKSRKASAAAKARWAANPELRALFAANRAAPFKKA